MLICLCKFFLGDGCALWGVRTNKIQAYCLGEETVVEARVMPEIVGK